MAVVSNLTYNGKRITEYNNSIISNIKFNGIDFHFAKKKATDSICENAVEEPVASMRIDGNSVQNTVPTPETPVEIESVGDKTKNLFNEELLLTLLQSSQVEKTEDGYLIKNYPAVYSITREPKFIQHLKSVIKPDVTYTLSRKTANYSTGNDGAIWIRDASSVIVSVPYGIGIKSTTFSLTQEQIDSIESVYIYGRSGDTPILFEYIQLEQGTEATEYEPYGYKVPIKIIGGKNLFNPTPWKTVASEGGISFQYLEDEDCFLLNGKSIKTATYVQRYLPSAIPVEAGKKYSLRTTYVSGSVSGGLAVGYFGAGNSPTQYYNWMNVALSNKTITSGAVCSYKYINRFWFYIENGVEFVNYKVKIQLEVNDKSTEHEQYMKILDLYLNEPLRKIGDYADYIDYKNKKVVRNIKEIYLEAQNWTKRDNAFYTSIFPDVISESNSTKAQSNTFIVRAATTDNSLYINYGRIYVYSSVYADENEFIAAISNSKVYCVFVTPTEETIDLPEISTSKGRNVFSVETSIKPSAFKLNYWKQTGIDELDIDENIMQIGSNILITETGASITQNESNLLIGG